MSFGYSIGDFIAGANLSYRLIKALSETQGASTEYQEAIAELATLQQTFLQVSQLRASKTLPQATINGASEIVMSSMELIGAFLAKTQKYRERLCGKGNGNKVSDSWQKMGWVLFKKEELRRLRDELHLKLSHISLLLATAQIHAKMPVSIAKYEVDEFDGSWSTPQPEQCKINSSAKSSHIESSRNDGGIRDTQTPREGPHTRNVELEKRLLVIEELMRVQNIDFQKAQKEEEIAAEEKARADAKAAIIKAERDAKMAVVKAEADAKAEAQKAIEEAEAQAAEEIEKAKTAAKEAVAKAQKEAELMIEKSLALNDDRKKPIKFKDAVGRKFRFPFHLCATWAGMEELIRQAFLHVDVIGPHVQEGHYDLLGADGEIILPQVWETMIEPDWSITMHMWPMPEPKEPKEALPPPKALLRRPFKSERSARASPRDPSNPKSFAQNSPLQIRTPNTISEGGVPTVISNPDDNCETQSDANRKHQRELIRTQEYLAKTSRNANNPSPTLALSRSVFPSSISQDVVGSESTSQLSESASSKLVKSENDKTASEEIRKHERNFGESHESVGVELENTKSVRRPRRRRHRRKPKVLQGSTAEEIQVNHKVSPP